MYFLWVKEEFEFVCILVWNIFVFYSENVFIYKREELEKIKDIYIVM